MIARQNVAIVKVANDAASRWARFRMGRSRASAAQVVHRLGTATRVNRWGCAIALDG